MVTAFVTGLVEEVLVSDGSSARVDSVLFEALIKDPEKAAVDSVVVEILHNNIVNGSLTEAASATDNPSGTAFFGEQVTEAASASDSPRAATTFPVSLSAAASATDTVTETGTFGKSLTEPANAASIQTANGIFAASLTEATSASATTDATGDFASILTEAASASATTDATGTFGVSLTETTFATATATAPGSFDASLTETATARATVSGPTDWHVSIIESADAQDFAPDHGAGGGGGGAAGLYGPGEAGFNGAPGGVGGKGGDADGHTVPGALPPGLPGNNGTELDGLLYGSGSGGSGAAFAAGAGATTYNYNGTIFLFYVSSIDGSFKYVTLTIADNASTPVVIPSDWTNNNVISLVGSGCTTHGEDVLFNNVTVFSPGESVAFFCSPFCSEVPTSFGSFIATSGVSVPFLHGEVGGDGGLYGGGGGGGTGGGGGRGGDGLIFLQYRSSSDHLIHTIVFHVADNATSPWHVPADWTDSNFVYLQGSGGCGDTGSQRQGGDGGGGGGATGGFDVSPFNPGDIVPFYVSSGCSGLPTILGPYAARSGGNGGESPESGFGLLDHFQIVLPCAGSTGDGTVGPTRPPGSVLVE